MSMTEHHLKTISPYYEAVARDEKPFEVRKNDRDFKVGDLLHLHFYDPLYCGCDGSADDAVIRDGCPSFLGSERTFRVSFIYDGALGGLEPGFVVLALGEVDE